MYEDSSKDIKEIEAAPDLSRVAVSDAEDANTKDHDLTIRQAFKLYPKAVAWSAVLSASCIMEGFDLKLFGLLFAQPAFNKAYGKLQPNGSYQISAAWQQGLNNGSNVGQMIGLTFAGQLTERLGFRKTMAVTLMVVPCLIFVQFFSSSLVVLQVGQILLGIPLGIFQTVTCVYAVEVSPACFRAFLTSWVSQNWVIGQIIAACVTRGTLKLEAPWAYRIPFSIQWFWPVVLFPAVLLAPESPWWLVRQKRYDEAKLSLRRLTTGQDADEIDKTVTLMALTTEHEREQNSGNFTALFKGTNLRRTLIVMGCYCMQIASGTTLRAYATYFFLQAGLPTDQSFNMSIVIYVLSLVGTIVAWFLMPYVGRRTLFLWGLSILTTIWVVLGATGIPARTSGLSWAAATLLVISGFVAYLCMIPVIFAMVSEIPSSTLRSKSVAIARLTYAVLNVAANVLTTYQLNPTAWAWGARSGFFWAGTSILALLFTWFYVPEPKGKTVTELDLLFEKGTPAREFAGAQVNVAEVAERS